jgi:hypothetical protein
MKHLVIAAVAAFALSGAATVASAQNAVVNQGSGAVSPLGPGQSPGSSGIGGSGTSAPPAGAVNQPQRGTVQPGMATSPNVTGSTAPVAPANPNCGNAVVNQGSGAVSPLGPGQSPATAGIGGSGTSAPPAC